MADPSPVVLVDPVVANKRVSTSVDGAKVRLDVAASLAAGSSVTANQGTAGATPWPVVDAATKAQLEILNSLVPVKFDAIALTYAGENLTQVDYELAAVVVATVELSYTGDRLDRVERTLP